MEIEVRYTLPFDTAANPVRISQGRNGPWSHFLQRREVSSRPGIFIETDLINAIDFALPLGTPVKAARSGRIWNLWHGSEWCYEGLNPEIGNNPPFMSTNFVIIEHDDGTQAWYSHLSKDVLAQRGQLVEAGSILGLTGKSGWIAEIPHLHIHVFEKPTSEIRYKTVPFTFEDYLGPLEHEALVREGLIWSGE